jgi:hypothetical protein
LISSGSVSVAGQEREVAITASQDRSAGSRLSQRAAQVGSSRAPQKASRASKVPIMRATPVDDGDDHARIFAYKEWSRAITSRSVPTRQRKDADAPSGLRRAVRAERRSHEESALDLCRA